MNKHPKLEKSISFKNIPEEQDEAPPFIDNNLLGKGKIINDNPFEKAVDAGSTSDLKPLLVGRASLQSNNSIDIKTRQLIFDKQLKCYYDPNSAEYFEMIPKSKKAEF